MSHPAEPARPEKQSRIHRINKQFLRVFLVLILLTMVSWIVWDSRTRHTFERTEERLREAGEPATWDEWRESLPAVAPSEDSGPYYAAAMALATEAMSKRTGSLQAALVGVADYEMGQKAEVLTDAEAALVENAHALALMDEAALLSGCTLGINTEDALRAGNRSFARVRALTRLSSLRTRFLGVQGDDEEAVASVISAFRLLRVLEREPSVLSALVRQACAAMTISDASMVLGRGNLPKESLMDLAATVDAVEKATSLQRTFEGERLDTMASPLMLPGSCRCAERPRIATAIGVTLARPVVLTGTNRRLSDIEAFCRSDIADWALAKEAVAQIHECGGLGCLFHFGGNRRAFEGVTENHFVCRARLAMLQTAIRIELHRLEGGQLPMSLDQLSRDESWPGPIDPFTGEDLI